jgi:hypothetical protein
MKLGNLRANMVRSAEPASDRERPDLGELVI